MHCASMEQINTLEMRSLFLSFLLIDEAFVLNDYNEVKIYILP